MVVDLGRDYYHLPDDKLTELAEKIRAGNMDDVLKVYESEMKVRCTINAPLQGKLTARMYIDRTEPAEERDHGQLDSHTADPGAEDKSTSCGIA